LKYDVAKGDDKAQSIKHKAPELLALQLCA
jgi:hypothetical protein